MNINLFFSINEGSWKGVFIRSISFLLKTHQNGFFFVIFKCVRLETKNILRNQSDWKSMLNKFKKVGVRFPLWRINKLRQCLKRSFTPKSDALIKMKLMRNNPSESWVTADNWYLKTKLKDKLETSIWMIKLGQSTGRAGILFWLKKQKNTWNDKIEEGLKERVKLKQIQVEELMVWLHRKWLESKGNVNAATLINNWKRRLDLFSDLSD